MRARKLKSASHFDGGGRRAQPATSALRGKATASVRSADFLLGSAPSDTRVSLSERTRRPGTDTLAAPSSASLGAYARRSCVRGLTRNPESLLAEVEQSALSPPPSSRASGRAGALVDGSSCATPR